MDEVSCQVTRVLIEALEESGVRVAPLLEGLPVRIEHLRQPKNRIDWDVFVALVERIEAACPDPAAFEGIGARTVRAPSSDFLRRVGRYMMSPQHVYEAWTRWIAPQHFLHFHFALSSKPDGRLVITVDMSPGYRDSASVFRLGRGLLGAVSTVLDLPPTLVEADIRERRVAYTLTLPPTPPVLERLRRASQAIRGSRAMVHEMARQQAALRTSYEELFRTRQDFRRIIESIPDVVIIHREGTIVWANRACAECLGYERSEVLFGRRVLDFVHPDDRESVIDRWRRPPGVKETAPVDEFRIVRKDGEIVALEVAPSRQLLFEGAVARLFVARDVTEPRRMREQLLLSDRLASLGTLAAGVAHEINNPLAYIYLNLEIAGREIAAHGGARLAKASEAIAGALEGAERVRAIVGDLKTFSRGHGEQVGPVRVEEVLESTLGLAVNELRCRARVVRDYHAAPPARANRGRLGQVFLNLLLNAADAIPEGRPEDHEIRVRTSADGAGRVLVEVSDTGVGIPEPTLRRIFDPFFTTKPIGGGTGLGLAICHHIVTSLGGEIAVDSAPGKGTTFRVALPAAAGSPEDLAAPAPRPARPPAAADAAADAGAAPAAGPNGHGAPAPDRPRATRGRVLVVDDEPALARSLASAMADDYEVRVAPSGRAALDLLLPDGDFDVILCDLMMSEMNGMELHRALREARPDLANRMVFMSAGAYTTQARGFLSAVPNRCLHKPFGSREVLEAVRESIAKARGEVLTGPIPDV